MQHSRRLNTGASIPAIGFGSWQLNSGAQTRDAVLTALQAGYRLIDTAKIYGNEADVGAAISESPVERDEVFLTTKVWNEDQGYDQTLAAFEASLQRLKLTYIDLYLIHWPATKRRHESWRALEALQAAGVARAVGVSNYTVRHLRQLLERSLLTPAVNQVEFHPFVYEQQRELLAFCKELGIVVEAYSPLARLPTADTRSLQAIADAHGKSMHQVVLRWCLQHGTVPLPRSASPEHIAANLDVFDFELSETEMDRLNSLSDGERVTWDPSGMGE